MEEENKMQKNICPICFSRFSENNLMHELIFYKEMDEEQAEIKTTALNNCFTGKKCVYAVVDPMYSKYFSGSSDADKKRYLMYPASRTKNHNDFSMMLHIIKRAKEAQESGMATDVSDEMDDFMIDNNEFISEEYDMDMETDSFDAMKVEYRIEDSYDKKIREYTVKAGINPVFKVIPCCPNCRARLPRTWFASDEFVPIAFLAPRSGGKTTIIESIIGGNFGELSHLGEGIKCSEAQSKDLDPNFAAMLKEANENLLHNKKYPDATAPHLVMPIFFNMEIQGKKVIVGLYDASGEVLEEMDMMNAKTNFLANMYGIIFLIDPQSLKISLQPHVTHIGNDKEAGTETKKNIPVLSIAEQGILQQAHPYESILVDELLNRMNENINHHNAAAGEMYQGADYNLTTSVYHDFCALLPEGASEQMHLAATIMKSDELETSPEIMAMPEADCHILFERINDFEGYLDPALRMLRSQVVDNIFKQFFYRRPADHVMFEQTFGKVSKHCISAVGCNKSLVKVEGDQTKYYYDGEYNPIRVAEPVLECVLSKLNLI